MAVVSKGSEVVAASEEQRLPLRSRGKGPLKRIIMVDQADINPANRKRCRSSSEGLQGSRSGLRRRNSYQREARDEPLVHQPSARPPRSQLHAPPSPPYRLFNPQSMRLLFQKKLQNSDVSMAGRIVIPKKEAEAHLPILEARNGFWMHLDDMDFLHVWTFKFRFWPNISSRMYLFENTKRLIEGRDLGVGDTIVLFKDDERGTYLIRATRDVMRQITHPTSANTLRLSPRPPFNESQVVPTANPRPVIEDHQTSQNNVDSIMDADPRNLQEVRAAEVSAVAVEEDHHQTTETEVDNVNENKEPEIAIEFPTFDLQTTETTENYIDVANMDGIITFPPWVENHDLFTIPLPLHSSDSGSTSYGNNDLFDTGTEQREPFYGNLGRSPINFESINYSIFE